MVMCKLFFVSTASKESKSDSHSRAPRATEPSVPYPNDKFSSSYRNGRLLPEHVDLGLRLTVGEDVVQKPFLPSSQGSGHFPESSPYTEPASNAYFPASGSGAGGGGGDELGDPSYICSPHSTLIVVIVIILVLNVAMVAAFVIFYRFGQTLTISTRSSIKTIFCRQKRKYWSKRVGVSSPATVTTSSSSSSSSSTALPPPIPSRPSSSTSGVLFKSAYHAPSAGNSRAQSRINTSISSLPRRD